FIDTLTVGSTVRCSTSRRGVSETFARSTWPATVVAGLDSDEETADVYETTDTGVSIRRDASGVGAYDEHRPACCFASLDIWRLGGRGGVLACVGGGSRPKRHLGGARDRITGPYRRVA